MSTRMRVRISLSAVLLVGLAGCGIPADSDGTLDQVRENQLLRAGASPAEGWVETDSSGQVTGREAQLIEDFAAQLGVQVEWQVGGEQHLIDGLEHDRLDVVIGGFTDETPWSTKAAVSRPYTEAVDAQGRTRKHVMLVPLGENAMLSELERFLDREGDQ